MSIYKSNKQNKDKQNKDHHSKNKDNQEYTEDELLELMGVYRDRYKRENRRVKRR